jgi:hypothetical protein
MGGASRSASMQPRNQLLVVELHAVGRLVFDAIPQRLELGLTSTDLRTGTCLR